MGQIVRGAGPEEWWDGLPGPEERLGGPEDWAALVVAVGDAAEAARDVARAAPAAGSHAVAAGLLGEALAAVALLQDVRRTLAESEAYLVRLVGQDEGPQEGTLPDGRPFALRKGVDRKAWDHQAWRSAVRRQVRSGVGAVVDVETGETVDLDALLAAAQDAQGAGAPKVTVLRALGLDADEFCERVPGPWGLQVDAKPTQPPSA